jgi:hypothetical protein
MMEKLMHKKWSPLRVYALLAVLIIVTLCLSGAFAMAMLCSNSLTSTQGLVFDMLNYGWMTGVAAIIGLLVGQPTTPNSDDGA